MLCPWRFPRTIQSPLSQVLLRVYDHIIVGAGSSGAAIAARLSEDRSRSVLLLEAGPDFRSNQAPWEMRITNPGPIILTLPRYQWPGLMARRTDVQKPIIYWRGRGLGGSSLINGLIAIRPPLEDFDAWARAGCDGWSANDVLPAFIRLEDDEAFGDAPYHGRGGPIPIYRAPRSRWGAVDNAVAETALALNYGWADDHNAPGACGVSPYAINCRGGMRMSSNDAYLEPARDRVNLEIVGDALVDRIEFDGTRATGVRVRIAGEWQTIGGGEIILSAGAIHSPAILMRSGIGPAPQLRALDIPVRADLPVGENLLDHPQISMLIELKPAARAHSLDARHTNCCVRYSSGIDGTAPNDMIMIAYNLLGAKFDHLAHGHVWASVYQSFSRGRLWITSRDPEIHPEIHFDMLSDRRDLVRMRDAIRRMIGIGNHAEMRKIAERVNLGHSLETVTTGANRDGIPSDEWIFANCFDVQHAAGTCRMGTANDPRAVVDSQCRVVSSEGLRVADASIFPAMVRANTHLTAVMVGELIAERIRAGK